MATSPVPSTFVTRAVHEGVRRLRDAADCGELDRVAERRGVRLLGIFGSASRPDADPADLDVAVSFAGPPDELGLIDDLVRLSGVDRIDLAVLDGADPVLRAHGLVGIPLYECEKGLFATEQMAALAERRDTEWLRRLDLGALGR